MENKDTLRNKINGAVYKFGEKEIEIIAQLWQKSYVGLTPKQASIKRYAETIIGLKNNGTKDSYEVIRESQKQLRNLFSYGNANYVIQRGYNGK